MGQEQFKIFIVTNLICIDECEIKEFFRLQLRKFIYPVTDPEIDFVCDARLFPIAASD